MLGRVEEEKIAAAKKTSARVWLLFAIFAAIILLAAWYYSQTFLIEGDSLQQEREFLVPPSALE